MNITKDEKPKKINIKDIAKIAKVSSSTVSRALRNDNEASKRTINKIKKIAKKLNYYPDALAKSLRVDKSNTIGIILNDMNNPFYSEVLWSIYKKLNEINYSIIITYSNWDLVLERKNIINLLSRRVDGIIISPILSLSDRKVINMDLLIENNIETVFVDNCPNQENVCYSGSDHQKAIYTGTKYLIENGHKEILFYSAMPISYTELYKEGYCKALAENNIKIKKI